jgi:hypothetical protein
VEKQVIKPWHKTWEENSIIYSLHWHALVPCGLICLWATDLRNPEGNYETRCIFKDLVSIYVNCLISWAGRKVILVYWSSTEIKLNCKWVCIRFYSVSLFVLYPSEKSEIDKFSSLRGKS